MSQIRLLRMPLTITATLALVLVLAACTQAPAPAAPASPAGAPTTGAPAPAATAAPAAAKPAASANTFIFGRGGDSVKLDPAVITDGESHRVTAQILEELVDFDGQTTNVRPSLADSWTSSADGKTWTFKLHPGIKFTDGTDFNSDAVVFNFQRWMDTKNPYHKGGDFTYFHDMFGGFKNDPSESTLVIDDVKAVDPLTVQFTLKTPQGPFLNNLAMFPFSIQSPTAIKKDVDNLFKNPVGTGPFKFVEWVPDDHITVDKNPDYWDKANMPKLDRIIFRVIKDNTARFLELKAGTIQGMEGLNPDDVKAAQSDPNLKVQLRPAMNVAYLAFNFKTQPELAKKEVRQAIAYGVNRQAIVDALYAGTGQVASQFLPPSVWGYNPDIKPYAYDPAKAKQLLAQAGVPNGFSMELWYMPVSRPYYPNPKPIAEAFAADLAKIGIKADLKTEDWSLYTADRKKGKFPFWMLGWTGDNGDPDNFLGVFFGTMDDENTWDNSQVRQMLKQAQSTTDKAAREKMYKDIAVIINDEMPRLPIANTTPPLAFRKNVNGYVTNPTGTELFRTVSIQ